MFWRLEELSDLGAAEILLPIEWMRERTRDIAPSLKAVLEIGIEACCSADYIARRIRNCGLWNCRFLWWQRKKNEIYAVASCPEAPREFLASIDSLPMRTSLVGQSLLARSLVEGRQELRIEGEKHEYRIQALPLSEATVLSLLI